MRLWSYQLISVLPNAMLVSQWRECIAIKRQWEKGTLKHRLVSYILKHDEIYFGQYVKNVIKEFTKRGIKYNDDLYYELCLFSNVSYVNIGNSNINYPEHNDRYLKQCLYNLQEKADRGIIIQEEWQKIEDKFGDVLC